MSVFIYEKDAFEKIVAVEGPGYIKNQRISMIILFPHSIKVARVMRTRSEFHQCLGTFHWGRIMLRDIWPWRMEQIFSQKYRRNIFWPFPVRRRR